MHLLYEKADELSREAIAAAIEVQSTHGRDVTDQMPHEHA